MVHLGFNDGSALKEDNLSAGVVRARPILE